MYFNEKTRQLIARLPNKANMNNDLGEQGHSCNNPSNINAIGEGPWTT